MGVVRAQRRRSVRRGSRPSTSVASHVRPVETLEGRVLFATFTWDGGGGDDNWTTGANWAGDTAPTGANPAEELIFPAGAARPTNTNDFAADPPFDTINFT